VEPQEGDSGEQAEVLVEEEEDEKEAGAEDEEEDLGAEDEEEDLEDLVRYFFINRVDDDTFHEWTHGDRVRYPMARSFFARPACVRKVAGPF
jgi:ABC-type lipopolysaccharide export system ATPase subunit